jgi:3-hydroxyisobutyrate dehydrogenase-like beta-hydroxyacid dehydrogenase
MAPPQTLGFVGLGIMGEAMAKNLLKLDGVKVVVWNRNTDKSALLADAGATVAASAADVAAAADVTFAMLSDPAAAEAVALGPAGVLAGLRPGTGFVDMSTVDAATSTKIAAACAAMGARFLEAPVSGSKQPAIGSLPSAQPSPRRA